MAYIYAADIFCDDCADEIRRRLAEEWFDNISRTGTPDGADFDEPFESVADLDDYLRHMDERTYDSDEYPKYCSDDEESDGPQHCGSHEDCINAGELPDGFKYGYCFGNDLTSDGIEYVKEAVRDGEADGVARLVWAVEYDWIDFDESEDCDDCA
jgi:hypothetical protein